MFWSNHFQIGNARLRRLFGVFGITLLATLFILPSLPAQAKDKEGKVHLPPLNNFATARFDVLSTVDINGSQQSSFGGGTIVAPDRLQTWYSTSGTSETSNIIQIGDTVYQRIGDAEWKQIDGSSASGFVQPASSELGAIELNASKVMNVGAEMVRDVPTAHYQIWITGERLLALEKGAADEIDSDVRDIFNQATIKYDLWVGTQDGFIHQQNFEFSLPATKIKGQKISAARISYLTTFYDINNPNISVNAPI